MVGLSSGLVPVPVYNGASGPNEIVDTRPLLRGLHPRGEVLVRNRLSANALPMFMVDANRYPIEGELSPGRFDNRWLVFPQDLPSHRFLRKHGATTARVLSSRRTIPFPTTSRTSSGDGRTAASRSNSSARTAAAQSALVFTSPRDSVPSSGAPWCSCVSGAVPQAVLEPSSPNRVNPPAVRSTAADSAEGDGMIRHPSTCFVFEREASPVTADSSRP